MSSPEFSQTLDATHSRLRVALLKNPRGYEWRVKQLRNLKKMIVENDQAISDACWKDLRKNKTEAAFSEQSVVISEIDDAIKNLKKWMRPKKVPTPLYNWPGCSQIVYEPFGLCLIIGAWNYPFNLLLAPLVGAFAAGNIAVLKPSEMAAASAQLIGELVPKYFDSESLVVIQGGAELTSQLLDRPFDFIFFTGSTAVGKIILSKAAVHLTPCVLELGGKSPAIVLPDCDLKISARRIAWGKFINSGQTCIAPDYVLIHPSIKDAFVKELKKSVEDFFGKDAAKSPDYGRIINQRNFDRIVKLTSDSKILMGGKSDRETLFIEPSLCASSLQSEIMKEEIFGPILPIVEFSELDQMIDFINSRPKPLALYLFSKNLKNQSEVVQKTSSGGVCINDNVMHMPEPSLPFGGVGASGMGHYHGRFSFEAFSHAKGVLKRSLWFDLSLRYAPYNSFKEKWLRRLLE